MEARQAVETGIRKSFQFSGRASRSEFWWFAPVGLLPSLVTANWIAWDKFEFFGIWRVAVLMVVSIPFLSAGFRRIQDSDAEGYQIVLPFMPFVILWITYQALYWFSLVTAITGLGLVVGLLALLVLIPAYLFALLTSLFTIGPVIGLLILPSDIGPNRYGPNPNEDAS